MRSLNRGVLFGCLLLCGGASLAHGQLDHVVHVYRVVESDTLRVYVFEPTGDVSSPKPAVLHYHGGGWGAGDPEWTFGSARAMADSGMVGISVQYRLSGSNWTPLDALEDVCESVRWVRRNAARLGIDPGRVAGHGVSAGGHLIASTGTVGCPGSGENSVPDVLLLWSPALDVRGDGWFSRQLQGRAEPAAFSPAQHVHAGTPPTSIVHGDRDTVTPLAGARSFCERLSALGTDCELNVYKGVGHLLTRNLANQESNFDPDQDARADGIAKHLRFLRSKGF